MKHFLFLGILVCGFLASLSAQNISSRKLEKLQSLMTLATQKLQQGNRDEAYNLYKYVREEGGYSQFSLTANDSIAWMNYEDGNLEEMYEAILFFDVYLKKHPSDIAIQQENQLIKEYYYQFKDNLTFSGDICGIWVSDYSENSIKSPYFIVEIKKNEGGDYIALIHPNCQIAKKYHTYHEKKYKIKQRGDLAKSECVLFWDDDSVYVNFAEKKFIKGCPTCAHVGSEIGISMLESAKKVFSEVTSDVDFRQAPSNFKTEVYASTAAVAVAGLLTAIISTIVAESKSYAYAIEMQLKHPLQGAMECTLTEDMLIISTSGQNEHKVKTLKMNLYRLYPDCDIRFVGVNNQLVGSHHYSLKEAKCFPEYKINKKMTLTHNISCYERLLSSLNNKAIELPEDSRDKLNDMTSSLRSASSGIIYGTLPTNYGYYIGDIQDGKPMLKQAKHYFTKTSHQNTVFWSAIKQTSCFIAIPMAMNNHQISYGTFLGVVKNGYRLGEGTNYEYSVSDNNSNKLVSFTHGVWDKNGLNGFAEYHDIINHQSFQGLFKYNYRKGHGVLVDSIKNVKYCGVWSTLYGGYEYLSGHVEERTLQGDLIYDGNYKWNKRHGFGIETSLNGNSYAGYWKKGMKHGKGTSFINSGPSAELGKYKEVWKKGTLIKRNRL